MLTVSSDEIRCGSKAAATVSDIGSVYPVPTAGCAAERCELWRNRTLHQSNDHSHFPDTDDPVQQQSAPDTAHLYPRP